MRLLFALFVAVGPAATLLAQPALQEPPEFPNAFPGPGVLRPGGSSCFQLASGAIVPGDVDWIQVTIPRASLQTVIDVDFPAGGGSAAASSLLAFVVGGASGFNNSDGNGVNDNYCGLGSTSVPVGSTSDSALSLGATPRNAVINIGITGAGDGGFSGLHNRTFNYDVWVYVVPGPCLANSDCYDGVGCTVEACLPGGVCVNTPDDGLCADGSFCNGAEVCDAALGCQAGAPPDCNDDVDCTLDACSDAAAACLHTPDQAACDDGYFCNGAEVCDATFGCLAGAAPDCDDGVACTADMCDENASACLHTPQDAACDNGNVCDGTEWCDAALGCVADAPLVCDDGLFCNGQESCDPIAGCLAGEDPCADLFCREGEARCVECETDADCDDGDFCNGAATCDAAGACLDGTPPCASGEVCHAEAGACEALGIKLDFKPGACPNHFALNSQGFVKAGLLGMEGFDLGQVVVGSLQLRRADGLGGALVPLEAASGQTQPLAGLAAYSTGGCACQPATSVATSGRTLTFKAQNLATLLGNPPQGTVMPLVLTGHLASGTTFSVTDCLKIVGNGGGQ
jgi:hypothetical protein